MKLDAKTARQQVLNGQGLANKVHIAQLKIAIDEAVSTAINKGMFQAEVAVHQDVDPDLINALERVLEKLGFKVRVENVVGKYSTEERGALYISPKTTITIGW